MRSQSKNIKDCFYKKDPKSVEASNSSYKRVVNAQTISVFSTTARIYFVQYEFVSVIDIATAFEPFLITNSAGPTSFSPDFQLYVYPSLVQG